MRLPPLRRLSGIGSIAAIVALAPTPAHAAAADLALLFVSLRDMFLPLWLPAGTLVLVIAGITLMISQDESALMKARTAILGVVLGGVLIYLTPTLINALYQFNVLVVDTTPSLQFDIEGVGLVNWVTTLAVLAAVIVVIISVARAVISIGDEQSYTNARFSLLYAVFGLLVIGASFVIRDTFFFAGTPEPLIVFVFDKLLIVMGLATLVAMTIIIYAGIRMVANFGNEEFFTQAKALAIRAVVGLLVILFSYLLVRIVIGLFS